MRLEAHLLCLNEAKLVPYVMDYWKEADKIYLYDNGSTDGSVELLSKYPNVEVIPFSTGGFVDEFALTHMRNTQWQRSKESADWIAVCDFDEVPYAPDGLKATLERHSGALRTKMHQIVCDYFPEYNPNLLLHQNKGIRYYDKDTHFDKTLLFPVKNLNVINFTLGSHNCHPNILIEQYPADISILHLKYLGKDYILEKSRRLYENLRPDIKAAGGIDWHYKKIVEDYDNYMKEILMYSYPVDQEHK